MPQSTSVFGARWILYEPRFSFLMSTGRFVTTRWRSCTSYSPAAARNASTSVVSTLPIVIRPMYGSWFPLSSTQMLYGFGPNSHGGLLIGRESTHGVTVGSFGFWCQEARLRKCAAHPLNPASVASLLAASTEMCVGGHSGQIGPPGEPFGQCRVGCLGHIAHGEVVDLLQLDLHTADPHRRRAAAELGGQTDVLAPEQEIVRGERTAVRPPHPLAQVQGEDPVVVAQLVRGGDVGHYLLEPEVPVQQAVRSGTEPHGVLEVALSDEAAANLAAVAAGRVDRLEHQRRGPDALGDRWQLSFRHELGELGRFPELLGHPRRIGDQLGALDGGQARLCRPTAAAGGGRVRRHYRCRRTRAE